MFPADPIRSFISAKTLDHSDTQKDIIDKPPEEAPLDETTSIQLLDDRVSGLMEKKPTLNSNGENNEFSPIDFEAKKLPETNTDETTNKIVADLQASAQSCNVEPAAADTIEIISKAKTIHPGKIPVKASQWYEQGEKFLTANRNEEALEAFKEALKLDPKHLKAKHGQSAIYYIQNDYEKCIEVLESCDHKKGARPWLVLGNCYLAIRKYDQAIQACNSYLAGSPKHDINPMVEANTILAKCYLLKNMYKEGIKVCLIILEIQPRSLSALWLLINFYLSLNKHEDTIKTCKTYIAIDSTVPAIYSFMGEALLALQKPDEAFKWFNKAIQLEKDNEKKIPYKIYASVCLAALGRFNEGLALYIPLPHPSFNASFPNNPEESRKLFLFGYTLIHSKCHLQAVEAFDLILKLNPKHMDTILERGRCLALMNTHETCCRAILDFNVLLEENPNDLESLKLRALLLYGCEKFEEAAADLNKIIKIEPDNKEYRIKLAITYYRLKDFEKAFDVLSMQIANNDPSDLTAFAYRGMLYVQKGQYTEALHDFAHIQKNKIKLQIPENDFIDILLALSKAYTKSQKYKLALDYAKEGLQLCKDNASSRESLLRECAFLYKQLRFNEEALEHYILLLEIKPEDPEALAQIKEIESILNQKEQEALQLAKENAKSQSEYKEQSKVKFEAQKLEQARKSLQEAKEREHKRQQEWLEKEKLKNEEKAKEIAKREMEKEIERKFRKVELHILTGQRHPHKTNKHTVKKHAISQNISGFDWWKDAETFDQMHKSPVAPAAASIEPAPVVIKVTNQSDTIAMMEKIPTLVPAGVLSKPAPTLISGGVLYKPAPFVYRPLPGLVGQPILLTPADRDRLLTAERMIKSGIEDLYTRAYGKNPYYVPDNETHQILVKHGFLYYILRTLEALHPTGRLLTKDEENLISIVNNFIMNAEKARDLRHQIRNYSHIIKLETLVAFAKLIKKCRLLEKIQFILTSPTFPKEPKPLQFEQFEFCQLKEKADWDAIKPDEKTGYLLKMISQQLKQIKSYIKPLSDNKQQFNIEGEIQNVLKMSIAIIGKYLTVLKYECGFKAQELYQGIFKLMIRHGKDVSHKIGEDIQFYEFDEVSPEIMWQIAIKSESLAADVDKIIKSLN